MSKNGKINWSLTFYHIIAAIWSPQISTIGPVTIILFLFLDLYSKSNPESEPPSYDSLILDLVAAGISSVSFFFGSYAVFYDIGVIVFLFVFFDEFSDDGLPI